ncbi:Card1-like endonuclease domain-containing protein [Vibrio rotiferianus]|uniref:Card1-like endonuclease domain-containing protein n=1 Tax=Vibrio rotiferianus TaxID=190895 RepID=UPI00039D38C1|nr:DUF1887 family CARF protein [Vibrio rotiferianus]PIB13136.1 hypothetical protein B853_20109 [Vibrio rotiferianus CAIM 577 = LMG 21460]
MLNTPHVQAALWKDNPISIVTPLLQTNVQCKELILLHPNTAKPNELKDFLSHRGIRLTSIPYKKFDLSTDILEQYRIQAINLTQGNTGEKDKLLTWARKNNIACYWLDHHTDTMSFLSPDCNTPIAIADKLKIEEFLALKGIQVTEIERSPAKYQEWVKIANQWVNNLARYEKGFRTLNYLAKTADANHHLSQALTLAQQNNVALRRIIDDLEHEGLLTQKEDKLQFTSAEAKRFCNGIWLEYYAFGQLKELKKSRPDIQDIAMSVKVERGDKSNPLRNEIDVIALINNRLYLVECKTGMLKPQESQLALYRLDSLAEVFGPLTQGALLSFDSISPLIKRRANEISISVLDSKNMVQIKRAIDKRASTFSTPSGPE